MSKKLLQTSLLLGSLCATAIPAMAQNASIMPDIQLPAVPGPVMRPDNASSSTIQLVNGVSGQENLFIHSWDGPTTSVNGNPEFHSGIAWRRSDLGGNTINEDFIYLKYASDIDAVIYEDGGEYYVLAAYYFDEYDPATKGHYYDIYRFDGSGLTPVSIHNLLTLSPTFGRINVDATTSGLAITWCVPGTGIYAKSGELSGANFGPNVLLPNTGNMVDPDVCIRRGDGGSGTGLDLQIAYLTNTLNVMYEYRVPFYDVFGGATTGLTAEYVAGTVGTNQYAPPRIDCPDKWGGKQRWAIALGISNYDHTTNMTTEWVYAVVKNEDWPGVAPTWTYPTIIDLSYVTYGPGWAFPTSPVIAYNRNQDGLTVGWITKQNTAVIPGTTQSKYVAVDVSDDGTAMPAVVPGSYNMISNAPCDVMPVLAFSGQDLNSDYDGLHIAFSEYVPYPPFYNIKYKDRKWGLSTFKGVVDVQANKNVNISVAPNPFNNALSFNAPAKGDYKITLIGIDGRVVYEHQCMMDQGQAYQINTPELASGTYVINVSSRDNKLNYTQKMVKK
ncbi:hypothetical protein DBR32_15255 [Taibaiella sp. KBW10]|uniref:T9SS type A sorting domain-containing protein n=1 Tax=Taibaiella sp. KBW10 TaxID=2153357 RepID=UPI000F596749|nr:T9SS type A sorting domain-containing protein [Taibaiella sp. KBW10]RQO29691.1 hypothetical protein DBR32_15255 [Taibaiella sp. KBW10]